MIDIYLQLNKEKPAINYLMRTKGIKKQKDLLKTLYEGYIKKEKKEVN